MNSTQATRLIRVADALRDAAEQAWYFNMETYGYKQSFAAKNGFEKEAEILKQKDCGTPACALGHYAVRKDLQRAFDLIPDGIIVRRGTRYEDAGFDTPYTREHFGLTKDEAYELFNGDGCGSARTADAAAEYIEGFVRNKGFEIS